MEGTLHLLDKCSFLQSMNRNKRMHLYNSQPTKNEVPSMYMTMNMHTDYHHMTMNMHTDYHHIIAECLKW